MNKILIKMANDWWDANAKDLVNLLSELSDDMSFHENLHVSDKINVFNYANINNIQFDEEVKTFLLKEICGELAEQVLASKYGVISDDLFDEDGNFYEEFHEEFNRLYDRIEELMMHQDNSNIII